MAKKNGNAKETVENTVVETAEEAVGNVVVETAEETTEVKAEETVKLKAEKPVKKVKELKTKHYQHPDDLCEFVNSNDIAICAIVAFDRFQALYYYENK